MSPPLLPSLVTFALSVRGDRAGREAGAFRDERCEREHLCKNARPADPAPASAGIWGKSITGGGIHASFRTAL